METLMIQVVVLAIIVTNVASFLFGRLIERLAWNKLIQQGKLPKPEGK